MYDSIGDIIIKLSVLGDEVIYKLFYKHFCQSILCERFLEIYYDYFKAGKVNSLLVFLDLSLVTDF